MKCNNILGSRTRVMGIPQNNFTFFSHLNKSPTVLTQFVYKHQLLSFSTNENNKVPAFDFNSVGQDISEKSSKYSISYWNRRFKKRGEERAQKLLKQKSIRKLAVIKMQDNEKFQEFITKLPFIEQIRVKKQLLEFEAMEQTFKHLRTPFLPPKLLVAIILTIILVILYLLFCLVEYIRKPQENINQIDA